MQGLAATDMAQEQCIILLELIDALYKAGYKELANEYNVLFSGYYQQLKD